MKISYNNPLKTRLIFIFAVISILLIALALYYLPLPTQVAYTLHGAEVDRDGNVINSGTLVIQGRIYDYLFQTDKFQLTHLELPGYQVGTVYESSYPLFEMTPMQGNYHTYALIELPEYPFVTDHQTNILFSEDHSCWIVAVMGRVFVGTTVRDPNYAQIMVVWGSRINDLLGN